MNKPVVLIVDDHEVVQDTLKEGLSNDGYETVLAGSAKELDKKLTGKFDIVLLDLVLPDADGLSLISKIREHSDVPIIVISSKDDMTDRIVGLEMGADDYVGKPLPLKELSSRIKAQLRRYNTIQQLAKKAVNKSIKRVKFGRWILDAGKVQVFDQEGKSCNLTAKEFRLLEAFVRSPNIVLSRDHILNNTRPDDLDITDRAVDVQILRIRKKIGDTSESGQVIQTVRGAGYMLAAETEIVD
jgi:two-component system OmpR family response regulator